MFALALLSLVVISATQVRLDSADLNAAASAHYSSTAGEELDEQAEEFGETRRSVQVSSTPVWTRKGSQAGAALGSCVTTLGDINRDGFADIAIGLPGYDLPGLVDAGRVEVFLGGPNGLGATPAWTLDGTQANARLGTRVAAGGDLNGDGFDDLLCSAPYWDGTQVDQGAIYVALGNATGLTLLPSASPLLGPAIANNQFGFGLATAGDVNGDGFADVLVGAPQVEPVNGTAYIFLGSSAGPSAAPAWQWGNEQSFGASVSSAGDLDGDGRDDIVIGVPRAGVTGSILNSYCVVYVNRAPSTGLQMVQFGGLTSDPTLSGALGTSVAQAGDSNRDGYSDFLASDPLGDGGYGTVRLWRGAPSTSTIVFTLQAPGSATIGESVAPAGDLNGDGFADIVVGAPGIGAGTPGEAYYAYGRGFGPPGLGLLTAGQVGDLFGYSVSTAGDVNGDGFSDLIVGAPGHDVASPALADAGAAYIYLGNGGASGLSFFLSPSIAGNKFGSALATGDANADGFSDLLVGGPDRSGGRGGFYYYSGGPTGLIDGGSGPWGLEEAGSREGAALAMADFNGDGYDDLVVAAPTSAAGGPNSGRVRMWLSQGGPANPNTPASWSAVGTPGAQFGFSVADAGDINADGFHDLLVGAPFASPGGSPEKGSAFIYLGGPDGPTFHRQIDGGGAFYHFGHSVSGIGDTDLDGYSDIALGEKDWNNGFGRIQCFRGSESGLATSPFWTVNGTFHGERVGEWLQYIGDVDRDGRGDLLAGIPGGVDGGTGEVRIYLGGSAGMIENPAGRLPSPQGFAGFGTSGSGAGDVNGDGYCDVVVGCYLADQPGNAQGGYIALYPGNAQGVSTTPSIVSSGFSQNGIPVKWLGYATAGLADFNGDGFGDFAVGAPSTFANPPVATDNGAVLVSYSNVISIVTPSAPRLITSSNAAPFVEPVANLGRLQSNAYRIYSRLQSPAGRTKARLEVQSQRLGALLGDSPQITPTIAFDTGAPSGGISAISTVVDLSLVDGISPSHWRVRTRSSSPFFKWGPWYSPPGNGPEETDLHIDLRLLAADHQEVGSPIASMSSSPNPSRGDVRLQFTLPARANAVLKVFDAQGRHVREIELRDLGAGTHTASWNRTDAAGQRVAPGLYFAVLESGGRRASCRLALVE